MKHKLSYLVLALLLVVFSVPQNAIAQTRILRVGFVDTCCYIEIKENGEPTGYGVEYMNTLAAEGKWQYEYVGGSWTECLQRLQDGTIDLLLPVAYTAERSEQLLFCREPCYKGYTTLLCREDDPTLFYDDAQSFAGRNVGLLRGNSNCQAFEKYAAQTNLNVNRLYYETEDDLNAALAEKKVDLIVSESLNMANQQKMIACIDYSPTYLVASVRQQVLMDAINDATRQVLLKDPFAFEKLQEQYFGDAERRAIGFTREETEFIEQSGPIIVLYEPDDYPQEWYDAETGEYKGLYPSLMQLISDKSGLRFIAADPSSSSTWERIGNGEAAILVSAYASDDLSETYAIQFSGSYFQTTSALVAKRGKTCDASGSLRVALLANQSGVISCVQKQHPNWKLVLCETSDECVEKVLNEQADAAMINNLVLQAQNYLNRNDRLVTVLPTAIQIPVSLAIRNDQPSVLVSVLNKTIMKLSSQDTQNVMWDTTLDMEMPMQLVDLIRRYPVYASLSLLFIVALISMLIYQGVYNRYKNQQNRLLEEKNRELDSVNRLAAILRKQSETDMLTGLLNKNTAESACKAYFSMETVTNAALFVLDIDNFKYVNDSNGHQYGDMMLEEFGNALRSFCRENDVVGRIGGDEFLILFKSFSDREQLIRRAEAICEACESIEAEKLGITCSIGIALYPEDGADFNALYVAADRAMYSAKLNGKSSYALAGGDTNKSEA